MSATKTKPADNAALAAAWEKFYAHCFAIINQCPYVRRLSSADREDCVQEVMVELVRRFGRDRLEPMPGPLQTGLIRALSRNKAADLMRRRYRKPEVLFDDGAGAAILDARSSADGPRSEPGEYISLVWEALISLDHEVTITSYLIFYLRSIEGWTVPEIAELFQIAPEQARARCHRVKKKFDSILKRLGQEHDAPWPS
jgi:RNA polymerase sigma factor (sigma-70 family)